MVVQLWPNIFAFRPGFSEQSFDHLKKCWIHTQTSSQPAQITLMFTGLVVYFIIKGNLSVDETNGNTICARSSPCTLVFRNARRKMSSSSADKPSVIKARAGLFWLQKTETVQDEEVDGEYGLVINGHSLVRKMFQVLLFPVAAESTLCKLCFYMSSIQRKWHWMPCFCKVCLFSGWPQKVIHSSWKLTRLVGATLATLVFYRLILLLSLSG